MYFQICITKWFRQKILWALCVKGKKCTFNYLILHCSLTTDPYSDIIKSDWLGKIVKLWLEVWELELHNCRPVGGKQMVWRLTKQGRWEVWFPDLKLCLLIWCGTVVGIICSPSHIQNSFRIFSLNTNVCR